MWDVLELAREGLSSGGFWVLLTPPVQRLRTWAVFSRATQSLDHPTLREGASEKEGFLE